MRPEVEKCTKIGPKTAKMGSGGPLGGIQGTRAKKEALKVARVIHDIVNLEPKREPKMVQKRDEKTREKREGKKRALGSVLVHFGEPFGSLFGSKIDPGAPSERFLGEKRHSEYTLLFVVI